MRVPRLHRNHFLWCFAFLCGIFAIHEQTNAFDLLHYFIWGETYTFPLSLHCNLGRLGNQICTYASLYGLSKLNRRRFIALNCNAKYLRDIFKGPKQAKSIHDAFYIRWNAYELLPYSRSQDAAIPRNSNFIGGYIHPCSYTFFDHVQNELRQELQFQDNFQKHAQDVIRKANVRNVQNVTYVGMHIRRGDYQKGWLDAFEGVPVNMEYFKKAVAYFRDKYRNVIFIAVSDDRLWCINNLSAQFGVYVPKEASTPAHDLAVLSNCNHTIITYGTFGFWGAYLAGGEVLYFDKFLKPNTTFSTRNFIFEKMYPPYWKGIVTVNYSQWEAERATDIIKKNLTKEKH